MLYLLRSLAVCMVSQFLEGKKRTRFHLHVRITLCNICHRSFFRPYSMSTRAGFFCLFVSFFFWLLLIAAKDFGTSKTLPLFKTWIPSRPPIPLKLFGKTQQSGRSNYWKCACSELYWKVKLGTRQCTLPLCTPQPHPTETESTAGLDGSGYLAQYQIRGVSPNAVDLRVFLAFGTVQTEETKTFINSKGFIIALMKSKSTSTAVQ